MTDVKDLLAGFHEYVESLSYYVDIDDPEALDDTLVAYVNADPDLTVADYDAMVERLSSHGWEMK